MTVQRLSALDAAFLALENDVQPLHVGSLLVLDGPAPDHDELRADLERRATAMPALRRRVQRVAGGLGRPVWVDDPAVRVGDHVRHAVLAAPGDETELCAFVARVMEPRLDVTGPLWEMWQVDGLDGGRWALVVKAHHTMVDGFVGTGLLTSLLSGDGPEPAPPATRFELLPAPGAPEVARAAASWTVSLPYRAGRSLARLVTEPDRVRDRASRLRAGVRTVAVPDLPPSVLAGPLGRRRLWRWVSYDLDGIEAAAARAGCTVNDVFLAALAGGYRQHLLSHEALGHDTRLRSIVPVSMRTGRDDRRNGNIDAALFVDLPVHESDARTRLVDVVRQTTTAKRAGVPTSTEALVRAADRVPAPVLDRAARAYVRRGQRRVNVAASNVMGPTAPLRVCGRRLLELVPYLPVALEVRTSCGLLSYADRASLAVTADADGCPDLDGLVSAIDASMAELLALPAADGPG